MIYALLCRDPDAFVDRSEVRAKVDAALRQASTAAVPLAETWGATPEAIAGRMAAESMFGPA